MGARREILMKSLALNSVGMREKVFAGVASAVLALGLAGAAAPQSAYADDPVPVYTYSLSTYNENSATVDGDNMQHVRLVIDYAQDVVLPDWASEEEVMDGLSISIAGYDITSDSYYRPVDVSIENGNLVLDIGNVEDKTTHAPAFTAIYGGVIDVEGTPGGLTYGEDGPEVDAVDIYTVIPTGVEVEMTSGEDTNNLSATVTHASNVRAMVHYVIYDNATGQMIPVHSGGTGAGNLGVGDQVTHAHAFMTMTPAQIASGMASSAQLPAGYSISADGANLTVTGPEGSKLSLYVFDDVMLQEKGLTFDGVVSTDGVWTEYLPDAQ